MWQDRLRPCAVFTETSEGFAPYYLAGIRHDLSQTTKQEDHPMWPQEFIWFFGTFHERAKVVDSLPGYNSGIAGCRHNLTP